MVLAATTGVACVSMILSDVQGVYIGTPVVAAYTVAALRLTRSDA